MPELQWRKSSYSHGDGGNCVEVAWRKSSYSGASGECVEVGWHKSSYSGGSSGNCLEARVDTGKGHSLVRDTQNRERGTLAVPAREWVALLADLERL
jgi:hypothetical protein